MILSTLTHRIPSTEGVATLAAMGYDYVTLRIRREDFAENPEWRNSINALRDVGIKVLLTWPNYNSFSEDDAHEFSQDNPEHSFKACDGRTNTFGWVGVPGSHQYGQFSHWNDEVGEALVADLPRWLEGGPEIDGVHVNVAQNDRMFPTDWYPFGPRAVEGTRMYWSFDESAQAKWAETSGGVPMPTHPDPALEDRTFYRWYQAAYINRLTLLADTALDVGLNHISTWFMPLTRWTAENMAGGTAGSIEPLEAWRQHIIGRDAFPLMMVAFLFGLGADWPEWRADGEESIRRACAAPFNWDLIIGAECDVDGATTPGRVRHHGRLTADMGASGILCGDALWLSLPPEAGVAAAFDEVRPLFPE